MNTRKLTRLLSAVLFVWTLTLVLAPTLQTSLCAALPTGGSGWTLTENPDGGWTLIDTVDFNDWTRQNMNGSGADSTGGLTVLTGSNFLYSTSATGDHQVNRFYNGLTIQPGTYTITFSVGRLNTPDGFLSPGFSGLVSGSWSWNNRITTGRTASATNTAPASENWSTWSVTYTIDADTTVGGGTAPRPTVVGTTLGFAILANGNGSTANYAFDNLTITYAPFPTVPEPAETAVFAGAMFLLLAVTLRHCRRHR
ncbi:hypothetical protein Ga0100231_015085 [Opitutaceae bacterium TAV4]|nr:hypothetical protein Ga0100231_015085 [Opitutaceae bacterium TAV4]RRJ99612.1 hypothetical protein Ga0100230_015925 [Opitutaceae bacterium TAV3]